VKEALVGYEISLAFAIAEVRAATADCRDVAEAAGARC